MTVLYFGSYNPNYARNRILIDGLRENGVEVIECNVRKSGFRSFPSLFLKYLKLKASFDLMIVGFPGQEVMFLARFLTRKLIIFDAFTSHYEGYILDRKYFSLRSSRAFYYRFLDKLSCRLADLVLLDTREHIKFFVREFKIREDKFRRIWIGGDDKTFYPKESNRSDGRFSVLFFGNFIPLQGTEYIIKAAKLLEMGKDIDLYLIGSGQDKRKVVDLANQLNLRNVSFSDKLNQDKLNLELARADVALGLFGDTLKTLTVIPNKVYEYAAAKKPIITADTPAIRELFDDRDLALVETANPKALAEKILELKANKQLRLELAENAHKKFKTFCTPEVLGRELKLILEEKYNEKKS